MIEKQPPAPVIAEMREADFLRYLSNAVERQRTLKINRSKFEKRLAELRQAEAEFSAQLYAVQGAITEIEMYWLKLVDEIEEVQGDGKLEPIENDEA